MQPTFAFNLLIAAATAVAPAAISADDELRGAWCISEHAFVGRIDRIRLARVDEEHCKGTAPPATMRDYEEQEYICHQLYYRVTVSRVAKGPAKSGRRFDVHFPFSPPGMRKVAVSDYIEQMTGRSVFVMTLRFPAMQREGLEWGLDHPHPAADADRIAAWGHDGCGEAGEPPAR